jgi:hypothetical protein
MIFVVGGHGAPNRNVMELKLKRFDPGAFIVVGLVIAVGGFLLIDDYLVKFSIAANSMHGNVLGILPYRYLLLASLLLAAFGLYRWWMIEHK